jgi:regulator of replication initiation timing
MQQLAHLQLTVSNASAVKERMVLDNQRLEIEYKKLASRAAQSDSKVGGMEEQMRASERELAAKASMLATTKEALEAAKLSQSMDFVCCLSLSITQPIN